MPPLPPSHTPHTSYICTHTQTRSGRRNRRAGSEAPPVIHHFRRVPGPLHAPASKSHPHQLAGLYKGLYGPHGCEMLAVAYDFSGSAAQIVATKLTGVCVCVCGCVDTPGDETGEAAVDTGPPSQSNTPNPSGLVGIADRVYVWLCVHAWLRSAAVSALSCRGRSRRIDGAGGAADASMVLGAQQMHR